MLHRALVRAVVAAVVVGGCAPSTDDAAAVGDDVQGGRPDTSTTHNFSVGLSTGDGALCSGTLIAPNLVLTARHCVDSEPLPKTVTCAGRFSGRTIPASSLFVSTGPRLSAARKLHPAKEITTPAATEFCGNDIALVTLADLVPPSEAEPATPVVFPMIDHDRIGKTVTAIGYGVTDPTTDDSGVRRIRENIGMLCVEGDDTNKCTSHFASMIDADREFVTEGYVCAGDSGGGAFDQASLESPTPYVLGALSRGPQTTFACLAAIYSRTDAHARMIVQVGKAAAERGGYPAPAWTGLELAPLPTTRPCATAVCAPIDANVSDTEAPPSTAAPPDEPSPFVRRSACAAIPTPSGDSRQAVLLSGTFAFALAFRRRRRARQSVAPGE